jgi:predicted ATP-grasp superfamily ATP-dependent carboligase
MYGCLFDNNIIIEKVNEFITDAFRTFTFSIIMLLSNKHPYMFVTKKKQNKKSNKKKAKRKKQKKKKQCKQDINLS